MGVLIEENRQTALLWCSGICEGPRLKGSAQHLPSSHSTDSVTGNSWMKFTESILEATKWWENIAQKTDSPVMVIFIDLSTHLHPNIFSLPSTFSPLWLLPSCNLKSRAFTFHTVWMLREAIPEKVQFQCYIQFWTYRK